MTLRTLAAIAAVLLSAREVSADHWAVLVAGSNDFGNYRHQSDICHSYQLLVGHGVPESNIITMFYDDIAADNMNPFPGQVFNRPADGLGVDVYQGCKKSYTGKDVTASNFYNVLRGNASGVTGGSGEVLRSTADDEVFIYYADHGAMGVIAMPWGPFVYADDLNATLYYMYEHSMYRKLTFYLEACESGSMFAATLPQTIGVYATTAANSVESSWGTYCPPNDMVNGTHMGTCLGDLYSVNWMENADATEGNEETLEQQYIIVKNETTLSHVCQFGDLTFTSWPIGAFEGDEPAPQTPANGDKAAKELSAWDARLASILHLEHAASSARLTESQRSLAREKLDKEYRTKAIYDIAMSEIISKEGLRGDILKSEFPVHYWDCYRGGNEFLEATACGRPTDYAMQYLKVVAGLCNAYAGNAQRVNEVLSMHCSAAAAVVAGTTSTSLHFN